MRQGSLDTWNGEEEGGAGREEQHESFPYDQAQYQRAENGTVVVLSRERSKARSHAGCNRPRRDASNMVRVSGHDRKKPYSSFRRFEKVRDHADISVHRYVLDCSGV